MIEQCKRYNIVRAVLNGYPGTLKSWVDKDPKRFISAPMILKKDKHPVIGVATLRQELREGRAGALGEIVQGLEDFLAVEFGFSGAEAEDFAEFR